MLDGACGMWVWEPPATLAPSMDRSCPSYQQVQKRNLSTLSWHWIQIPHRLVCSEGLCIAAGRLGRSHTEQNLHVFMLKLAHPPTTQHSGFGLPPLSTPLVADWLPVLQVFSGELSTCQTPPNQTTKASNGWMLYFLQEVCGPCCKFVLPWSHSP